jgi:hypothetical protein
MRGRKAGNPKWGLLRITFEEDDIPIRKNVLLPFKAKFACIASRTHASGRD